MALKGVINHAKNQGIDTSHIAINKSTWEYFKDIGTVVKNFSIGYLKCNNPIGYIEGTTLPEASIDLMIANSKSKLPANLKLIYCIGDSGYDAVITPEGVELATKAIDLLGDY